MRATVLVVLLFLASSASADVVRLKGGGEFRGRVVSGKVGGKTPYIEIRTAEGPVIIPADLVEGVEMSPPRKKGEARRFEAVRVPGLSGKVAVRRTRGGDWTAVAWGKYAPEIASDAPAPQGSSTAAPGSARVLATSANALVSPGQSIRTEAGAWIILQLGEDVVLKIEEESEVSLAAPDGGEETLDVVKGTIRVEETPGGDDSGVKVRVPQAILGVEGTRFRVTAGADATTVRLLAGSVRVSPSRGGKAVVVHGGKDAAIEADGTVKIRPYPEKERDSEESAFGRPFAFPAIPMVLVPGGTFVMGSDTIPNAGPAHSVTLSAYLIAARETDLQDYVAFARYFRETGSHAFCHPSEPRDLHHETPADPSKVRPLSLSAASNTDWFDAYAFAAWCGTRLPTEAEWERAAIWTPRGTSMPFPWGDHAVVEYANCADAIVMERLDTFDLWQRLFLTPMPWKKREMGLTQPSYNTHHDISPSGCYGMAGNVAEWCQDWFSITYFASSPRENPRGPEKGDELSGLDPGRVVRGRAWYYPLDDLRVRTYRDDQNRFTSFPPTRREPWLGFRVAETIPGTAGTKR